MILFTIDTYGKLTQENIITLDFETTFYRNLVERYRIREIEIAKELLEFLISNTSNFISITKIHNTFKSFGINVSKRTLWKYYNYILESFLIF